MRTEELRLVDTLGWKVVKPAQGDIFRPQLVFFFGGRSRLFTHDHATDLKERYPHAEIIGCSTAGEIQSAEIYDESVVACAVEFAHTPIQVFSTHINAVEDSYQGGYDLAQQLPRKGLKAVLTLADGVNLNGTQYVRGLTDALGHDIPVSGGMAGDDPSSRDVCVIHNSEAQRRFAVVVGLYGENIRYGHGCFGGWTPYGPQRVITRSHENILYELDGKPALELYKRYLGPEAKELPGSAQLFPLTIRPQGAPEDVGLVRTVLDIDEENNALLFTGDMPEGHDAQLMHANFERIIEGAEDAARLAQECEGDGEHLALLVSCLGRRMVLGQHTIEEVEAACNLFEPSHSVLGFYSYGEISPYVKIDGCQFHNQTMTITILGEVD